MENLMHTLLFETVSVVMYVGDKTAAATIKKIMQISYLTHLPCDKRAKFFPLQSVQL